MLDRLKFSESVLNNDRDYPASRPLSEVIPRRRDTTSFKPEPIPDEVLRNVLESGLLAPSGCNLGGRFGLKKTVSWDRFE